jgi:CheY-like chemotaxis protein
MYVIDLVVARKLSFVINNGGDLSSLIMANGVKYRFLVADDAVLVRKIHQRVLSPFCREFVEASDGREAVEKVRESIASNQPFDAILMDSSMPFMNGTTATKLIRELGYTGKIFGITGNAFQSDIDDFKNHGVDEVLIKPVTLDRYGYIIQSISTSSGSVTPITK